MCEDSIPGLQIEHIDISDLPLLNTNLETTRGGLSAAVELFRARVRAADCFLFSSPKYNFSISGRAHRISVCRSGVQCSMFVCL